VVPFVNEEQHRARWIFRLAAALFALCFAACDGPIIYSCPDPSMPCDFVDAGSDAAADAADDADAGP
jgi:hypothetical protein